MTLTKVVLSGILLTSCAGASAADWSKDFEHPIPGPYSAAVDQLASSFSSNTWDKVPSSLKQSGKLTLECFFDSSQKSAVGVIQYMKIAAPKEAVQKIMDNIDGFQTLFPDYKKIAILEKRNDKWLTYWEQKIPFPFSNIPYRMLYHVTSSGDNRLYRYQLTWSDDIRYSDGLIALSADPKDSQKTRYFEIDFWDVKLGLGGIIAPSRIRRESIEGVYVSDKAVQLKSERSLTDSEILKLAKTTIDRDVIEKCLSSNGKFRPFWKNTSEP